jgi:hypothetical protein
LSSFRTLRSGDPEPSDFALASKVTGQTRHLRRLDLRAIGYTDVRFGIRPSQSGSVAMKPRRPGMKICQFPATGLQA